MANNVYLVYVCNFDFDEQKLKSIKILVLPKEEDPIKFNLKQSRSLES